MAIKLADLKKNTRTFTLAVGDEELHVEYVPAGVTPEVLSMLQRSVSDDAGLGANMLVEIIGSMLVRWDLLDDDGQEIKPDPGFLGRLPIQFLSQVVMGIVEDMRPNPSSAADSGAGS